MSDTDPVANLASLEPTVLTANDSELFIRGTKECLHTLDPYRTRLIGRGGWKACRGFGCLLFGDCSERLPSLRRFGECGEGGLE